MFDPVFPSKGRGRSHCDLALKWKQKIAVIKSGRDLNFMIIRIC
tara:strand:+ start:337 stop:468 length:132 start_codon:yes stop_codon:yes gene_type:complete